LKNPEQKFRARRLLVASAILTSGIAFGSLPGLARAADTATTRAGTAQTAKSKAHVGVDALIAHLHDELKITPAQESQFQKLADVMRANAETMRTMAKKRAEEAGTMTAVDDLKSYAEISRAHAEDSEKMVPVFEALYDSMSDEQKKLADQEFREHYATHHHHHHST
jgi:hypothetical protein